MGLYRRCCRCGVVGSDIHSGDSRSSISSTRPMLCSHSCCHGCSCSASSDRNATSATAAEQQQPSSTAVAVPLMHEPQCAVASDDRADGAQLFDIRSRNGVAVVMKQSTIYSSVLRSHAWMYIRRNWCTCARQAYIMYQLIYQQRYTCKTVASDKHGMPYTLCMYVQ